MVVNAFDVAGAASFGGGLDSLVAPADGVAVAGRVAVGGASSSTSTLDVSGSVSIGG